jgi:hypothetical protein
MGGPDEGAHELVLPLGVGRAREHVGDDDLHSSEGSGRSMA